MTTYHTPSATVSDLASGIATLLPCPFCGCPAMGSEKTFWNKAVVECANRLCRIHMYGNHDDEPFESVAARWNTRHSNRRE